jgi:polyisoprenoid-binding protein YceI
VRTRKTGAAAAAGHNLLIEVTSWEATLDESSLTLTADPRSLRVLEGSGGAMPLGDKDKNSITETIDDDVLKGAAIEFRSTKVDGLHVQGELELARRTRPIVFDLAVDGDRLTGAVSLKQSDWGIKPYSALFGTLKVVDEVQVAIDAALDG